MTSTVLVPAEVVRVMVPVVFRVMSGVVSPVDQV